MKLSENFELEEFVESETASARGIDNTPTDAVIANLKELCVNVLEPARKQFGAPMVISSGYRCPELNKAVGGASNSQHLQGKAADIVTYSEVSLKILFTILQRRGQFDQLLYEHSGKKTWIHVSYNKGHNRKMCNENYQA